jgi:hypothetical protein
MQEFLIVKIRKQAFIGSSRELVLSIIAVYFQPYSSFIRKMKEFIIHFKLLLLKIINLKFFVYKEL